MLVEDVNDNEPIFKSYPSAITVKEDAPPGILTTVEATDLDEGAYGQVSNYVLIRNIILENNMCLHTFSKSYIYLYFQ